jgi:release factor glutamine methyltransferase
VNASDIHHTRVGQKSVASIRDALGGAVDALAAAGVDDPRLDAEILLCEATGWDRTELALDPDRGVPPHEGRRFAEMVRRRLRREPVAYILGRRGFRHIELAVDRRVLIPRPETELLVELALELRPRRVLDVGTGSGAVALAIAGELPGCKVTATDTSPAALEVARANAERLGLADRVELVAGTLPPSTEFDLVVANLPYVSEAEWGALEPEVTEWEPGEALLAGTDGLDAIRDLLAHFAPKPGGGAASDPNASPLQADIVALEVGRGQADAVGGLLREAGFGTVRARRDLAGIDRVVWGSR